MEKEFDTPLPPVLVCLLQGQNGGLWFNEYRSFSANEIQESAKQARSEWNDWENDQYIPIAGDIDGSILLIDKSDEMALYEFDGDGKGRVQADSLEEYLETFREKLLSGKYEFVEEVGIVEKTSSRK